MSSAIKAPRDGSIIIAGIPWLARMIDKSRLEAAGEIEALDLDFPCPLDQRLLAQLGIDSETFQLITVENDTDDKIIDALKNHGVKI